MLKLVRGVNGQALPDTASLPPQLSTLKAKVTQRLPLLDMQQARIPLNVDQLATGTAARKRNLRAAQQVNSETRFKEVAAAHQLLSTMRFFDPQALFKAFSSSQTGRQLHRALEYFIDNPRIYSMLHTKHHQSKPLLESSLIFDTPTPIGTSSLAELSSLVTLFIISAMSMKLQLTKVAFARTS